MNYKNEEIVARASSYVEEIFKTDFSGHDFWHTFRVYKNALGICKKEGADEFLVALIALLHDVDDVKLSEDTHKNKEKARKFLTKEKLDRRLIDLICKEIDLISFSGSGKNVPETLEGKIVQDADRLDAIGAIGIARAFSYGASHQRQIYDPQISYRENMTEEEYRKSDTSTINHFYEKLLKLKDLLNTKTAREIAKQRDGFMRDFLDNFFKEWEGQI